MRRAVVERRDSRSMTHRILLRGLNLAGKPLHRGFKKWKLVENWMCCPLIYAGRRAGSIRCNIAAPLSGCDVVSVRFIGLGVLIILVGLSCLAYMPDEILSPSRLLVRGEWVQRRC